MNLLMIKSYYMGKKVMEKARRKILDEKGEVNIVATVLLIGIAVMLAMVFKKQITNLIQTLFNSINGQAADVIKKN